MKSFLAELTGKIQEYRLDEKKPNQTVSGVDWEQVLIVAEHGFLSEKFARNFLFLIEKDINYFNDFPDFTHRSPKPEQLYKDGRPHVRLGHAVSDSNLEVGVRFDLPLFMVCSGLIGFGKTNTFRVLLEGINQYNSKNPNDKKTAIVFDSKGVDYGDMAKRFGWKHFDVYQTLPCSLENPAGMPPDTWINIIASLFCNRAGLNFAWTTFAKALKTLLVFMNPQPNKKLDWPTFQNILDFLTALPETVFSTKPEYVRSLKQALHAICLSSAKIFTASQGFDIEDFIRRRESLIIHMPNMEPGWVRQLFRDIIISKVLKGRMERSERVDSVEAIFFIEEADADVDAASEKSFSDSMSPISECFKKGRAFGLGACISVSSLLPISRIIKENATVHCAFRPSDARAIAETAETLMLPPYGELTLGHLGKGDCLFKQIGPWPHAMKVKIDHMPFSKTPIIKYDSHPYKPSIPVLQIPQVREFIERFKAGKNKSGKDSKAKPDPHKELAIKLLKTAAENPYVPVNRLFKALDEDYHYTVQQKVCKLIENAGWAKFEEPRIGRSNILLIQLTDEGYQSINHPIPKQRKGRGGITHRHYVHWLRMQHFEAGYKTQIEFIIPGTNHPTDVAVWMENKLHIFEICVTSFGNVVSSINTVLNSDEVECLTIITSTDIEMKKLKKDLKSQLVLMQYAEKLKFDVISNYMLKDISNETD